MNLESAFEGLLEKAVARGVTKKNNPNYKMTFDKNGHKIWVLVNKNEVDAHPGEKLSNDEFHKHRSKGTIGIHYDEIPEVKTPEDVGLISFLSENQKKNILSNLDKIKFYEGSIKLASSLKRQDVVNGHTGSMNLYKQQNFEILKRAFNGKNSENVLDEQSVEELNKDSNVNIRSFSERASEFLNTYYKGFNFHELIDDCKNTFAETRKNLAKNLDIDEIKNFDPKIQIDLSGSQFILKISQDEPMNLQKDKFGFEHSIKVNMSRVFKKAENLPVVDHSLFEVGNGLKGSFAKNIMKDLYKQYANSKIDKIDVHANFGNELPTNGENTWGKWGFTMSTTHFETQIRQMKSRVGMTKMVEQFYIKHKEENNIIRKSISKNGIEYDQTINVAGFEDPNTGLKNTFQIVTKGTNNLADGYKSKVSRYIEVKKEHVDQVKKIYEDWKKENPNETQFRVKELYDKMNKDVVLVLMNTGDWYGECKLSNEKQRADFESNLFKQYPVKNNTVIT